MAADAIKKAGLFWESSSTNLGFFEGLETNLFLLESLEQFSANENFESIVFFVQSSRTNLVQIKVQEPCLQLVSFAEVNGPKPDFLYYCY